MKKIAISVGLAFALAGGISGCSMMSPSAKSGENQAYFNYQKEKPSMELVQLKLPIKENTEINEKLKLANKALKLSIILTDMVYNNAELDALMDKNQEAIAKLTEKIKGKSQEEQEKELTAMLDKLEATPEFKHAQKIVNEKGKKALADLKKLGVDTLKEYIVSKLNPKALKSNPAVSKMGYLDLTKTLSKAKEAVAQITYTADGVKLITQRSVTNAVYKGQDVTMYLKNSLTKAMTADLTEAEATDS